MTSPDIWVQTLIMKRTSLLLTLLVGSLTAAPTFAQRGGRPERSGPQTPDVLEVPTEPSIAWFGSWEAGLAEAERTGRPILLMSAAPQCHGVPGMW